MNDGPNEVRDKRNGVILRAAVGLAQGQVERRVRNLSQHGACIDHDGELTPGMTVTVAMGSLSGLKGTVMWAGLKLAGLRFEEKIDLDAARAPRAARTTAGGTTSVPRAGWMADVNHAYRRGS